MKKLINNDTLKLQKIENLLFALITIIQQKSESKPNLSILTQRGLLQQLSIAPQYLKILGTKWFETIKTAYQRYA